MRNTNNISEVSIDGNWEKSELFDNLTIQDEMLRYEGNLYYFYGISFDDNKIRDYIIHTLIIL